MEDICDSKSKKLINVKKEDSRPLNIKNESSRKEQDMPDVIISKICKNEERRINIEFRKETEEEILSSNCLSDVAMNLAQLVIHKQFPSINGLEHVELGLRKLFSIRKGKFLQILFGNYHLITVCGSNEAEVSVYDSLNKGSVHRIFLHQISDMVKTSTDNIRENIRTTTRKWCRLQFTCNCICSYLGIWQ